MMFKDYGLHRSKWVEIKEDVMANQLKSKEVIEKYDLDSKQVWFLYDKLLQEKYNHLHKRDKLVDPKVGDFVYCDTDGFGRGVVYSFSLDETIMIVKFDKRPLNTFCDAKSMCTNFDEVKRKITRL